jgi:serine protease
MPDIPVHLALAAAIEAATIPRVDGLAPARFAVKARSESATPALAAALAQALAAYTPIVRPLSPLSRDILVAILPSRAFGDNHAAAFEAAYALRDATEAEDAEPDLPSGTDAEPNPAQPGVEDAGNIVGCWLGPDPALQDKQRWAIDKVKAEAAWAFSRTLGRPAGGQGVVIGHLDTGLTTHGELAGVTRVPGLDLIDQDNTPDDPLGYPGNPGHGTSTASVLASLPTGVMVGTAPAASLMPIRCITSVVILFPITVAQAIDEAVARGAHVITMSLGGAPSFSLFNALRRAVQADVIVLAAAGNCVRQVVWPARYEDCIAVAGSNFHDKPWQGSCRGTDVDVSAPAENVFRAKAGGLTPNEVGQGEGTSFAVALAAGAAACWLAHHGRANVVLAARRNGETVQALFRRLVSATASTPPNWDTTSFGTGVLDMRRLLEVDLGFERGREAGTALEPPTAAGTPLVMMVEAGGEQVVDRVAAVEPMANEVAYHLLQRAFARAAAPQVSPKLAGALGADGMARLGLTPGLTPAPAAPAAAAPAIVPREAPPAADAAAQALRRRFAARRQATDEGRHESSFTLESVHDESPLPEADAVFARIDPKRPDEFLAKQGAEETADVGEVQRALELLERFARPAYAKLKSASGRNVQLDHNERFALEAVILTDGSRPSFLLRKGAVDEALPEAQGWKNDLVGARNQIKDAAAAIGRIEPTAGGPGAFFGTGALFDNQAGLVLTNFHVLHKLLGQSTTLKVRNPAKPNAFRIFGGVYIEFVGETGATEHLRCRVVEAIAPDGAGQTEGLIDAAVLRIEPPDGLNLPAPITLSVSNDPVVGAAASLCVIGFPGNPGALDIAPGAIDWNKVIGTLFNNRFGLKRLAPGTVTVPLGNLEGPDRDRVFGHDATTLGGSSGSIMFSWLDSGNPGVGLHYRGSLGAQSTARGNSCHAFEPIAASLRGAGVRFAGDPP